MAELQSVRALQLHELLSAPMVAMIQADAQAARATLEFIETVGFLADASAPGGADDNRLRMARFRYKKLDENGAVAEFVAEVPVLSLVPVPALQIKEAKIALSAKIVDIAVEPAAGGTGTGAGGGAGTGTSPAGSKIAAAGVLASRKLQLLAKPASTSGAKTEEVRTSFDLDIQITLGQADIPLGMEKIFQLMDQAIRDEKPAQP